MTIVSNTRKILVCRMWLLQKVLSNLDLKYKNVLIVYAAAFGMYMKKFKEVVKKRNVSVLDWYSFEHHVLSQPPFNQRIELRAVGCTSESLEQFATERLSQIIRYSKYKSSIKPCLTKSSLCNTCNRVIVCQYVHHYFDLGIRIAGSFTTGKMGMF